MSFILGIDVGTTNCKAGMYKANGTPVHVASRTTVTHTRADGGSFYDPEELWGLIASSLRETMEQAGPEAVGRTGAIGVTSMAEAGLLVDRSSGEPRSPFIPWFDPCSMEQAERVKRADEPLARFRKTGLHPSFKYGLPKLLWIREQHPAAARDAVWLSAADYIAFRLTGKMATDDSLAARTYAYDIGSRQWDEGWIREFGFRPELFPQVLPSGTPMGKVTKAASAQTGLPEGIPVSVCGHDHVCASLAVGAADPGTVFDSMGTAETLVGTLPVRPLGQAEYESGLAYGVHVVKDRLFWMGGISASGASVEWVRSLLSDPPLAYQEMNRLAEEHTTCRDRPTGLLYYPYLSGSGAPQPDPRVKASFIGLAKSHTRGDLIKAVMEGVSFELESIRRAAEQAAGLTINHIYAVGGGTRSAIWMRIKAHVTGARFILPDIREATLLGAAMTAAVGCGLYADGASAIQAVKAAARETQIAPDYSELHDAYNLIYEKGYRPLQGPLRAFCQI